MFGLFDWLKIGAGAALGAVVAAGPVYLSGKAEGRQQAAVAALEASMKVLRERNEIDDKVSAADATALCADLGLSVDDEAECVRRLREADAEPRNVGSHPSQ
jgi:hypothetical protein